jgi:hypothetical protein
VSKRRIDMKEKIKKKIISFAKGQTAIEYLITYGWAIAALLLVLGILLFYSTSLSPSIPEKCIFPKEIICNNFYLSYNSSSANWNFSINITNNLGFKANITNVTVFHEAGSFNIPVNKELDDGNSAFISGTGNFNIPLKDIVNLRVNIYYCVNDQQQQQCTINGEQLVIKGTITAKVQRS